MYAHIHYRLFCEKDGVILLTNIVRSWQHTTKITHAAHKIGTYLFTCHTITHNVHNVSTDLFQVCSQLWEYKQCKSDLKKLGWDLGHYQHLIKDANALIELVPHGSMSSNSHGSHQYKKSSNKHFSKKSFKKMEVQRELEEGEVRFVAGVLPHEKRTNDVQLQVKWKDLCISPC